MQIKMATTLHASIHLTLPTAGRADALAQCAPVGRAQIVTAIPHTTGEDEREQEHKRVTHATAHVATQYTAGIADSRNRRSVGVRCTLVIGLYFR